MQTPIGEGLGSSDALAPVASLSVDEGAPLTPAAVRGAGIIGGSGLDYSQTHAPSSALTEAEVQSPVVRPADLHRRQELLQTPIGAEATPTSPTTAAQKKRAHGSGGAVSRLQELLQGPGLRRRPRRRRPLRKNSAGAGRRGTPYPSDGASRDPAALEH